MAAIMVIVLVMVIVMTITMVGAIGRAQGWSRRIADLVSAATSAQSTRMKLIGFAGIVAALLLPITVAHAGARKAAM